MKPPRVAWTAWDKARNIVDRGRYENELTIGSTYCEGAGKEWISAVNTNVSVANSRTINAVRKEAHCPDRASPVRRVLRKATRA